MDIMNKLVIYYSFEGNTKFVAQLIAGTLEADLLELKPKNEIKSRGFIKYFWGGKQVIMKEKPELLPFDKQFYEYDMLFIGTPVWAWGYAPPLATLFSATKFKGKKIALFCCHGGGKGRTLEKMKESLLGNEIIGEIDFIEPLKRDKESNKEKARKWAKEMANRAFRQ